MASKKTVATTPKDSQALNNTSEQPHPTRKELLTDRLEVDIDAETNKTMHIFESAADAA